MTAAAGYLDGTDQAITDTDLGSSLADGRVTVSMTIDAQDPGEVVRY